MIMFHISLIIFSPHVPIKNHQGVILWRIMEYCGVRMNSGKAFRVLLEESGKLRTYLPFWGAATNVIYQLANYTVLLAVKGCNLNPLIHNLYTWVSKELLHNIMQTKGLFARCLPDYRSIPHFWNCITYFSCTYISKPRILNEIPMVNNYLLFSRI